MMIIRKETKLPIAAPRGTYRYDGDIDGSGEHAVEYINFDGTYSECYFDTDAPMLFEGEVIRVNADLYAVEKVLMEKFKEGECFWVFDLKKVEEPR